jgi:hypothetical protein
MRAGPFFAEHVPFFRAKLTILWNIYYISARWLAGKQFFTSTHINIYACEKAAPKGWRQSLGFLCSRPSETGVYWQKEMSWHFGSRFFLRMMYVFAMERKMEDMEMWEWYFVWQHPLMCDSFNKKLSTMCFVQNVSDIFVPKCIGNKIV